MTAAGKCGFAEDGGKLSGTSREIEWDARGSRICVRSANHKVIPSMHEKKNMYLDCGLP